MLPESVHNPVDALRPGQSLGRYDLLVPVAAGGMARVWAARLTGTRGFQKIVAIKTMLPEYFSNEKFEKMFLEEATLASRVRHPHVAEILELGEQDGVLFMVMEWVDGVSLATLMKKSRKAIPLALAVRIGLQACAGLHAAHELRDEDGKLLGLVHRDVSLGNVMVTYTGATKVVDFGIAKLISEAEEATEVGKVRGKMGYMAPEMIKSDVFDRRVDIFALGCCLYSLTTGRRPFAGENEADVINKVCSPDPPPAPSTFNPNFPPALERILLKALAKDPEQRFKTANDMLRELSRLPTMLTDRTDEDVGKFIDELCNEVREDQRNSLTEALRATENDLSNGAGDAARLSSNQGTHEAMTLAEADASKLGSSTTRNLLFGAVGLLVVILLFILLRPSSDVELREATETATPSAAAQPEPEPSAQPSATATEPEPAASSAPVASVDAGHSAKDTADEEPEEEAEAQGGTTAKQPAQAAPRWRPPPRSRKPSWKLDPGF